MAWPKNRTGWRRPKKNTAPLRKIVGYTGPNFMHEILECRHIHRIRMDYIGETHAERRRCRKCQKGAPPDLKD